MKCAVLLFLLCAVNFSYGFNTLITKDTVAITDSDSFGRAQFGQRQNFFLLSYCAQFYPDQFVAVHDHSGSGRSNLGQAQTSFPRFDVLEYGILGPGTNVLQFIYHSSNGGLNSNSIYGIFSTNLLQFPTNIYTSSGYTNDFPYPKTNATVVVIGDIAYNTSDGQTATRDAAYGARSAALEDGLLFVDSWTNTSADAIACFNSGIYGTLWFPNSGAFDHPNNTYNLLWHLYTIRSLELDTNVFTHVLDWNSTTPSQTNHCTVTSMSKVGITLTYTFHADRMGSSYYSVDSSQTNDCLPAFTLHPELANVECEMLRVTNVNLGVNYSVSEDGVTIIPSMPGALLSAGTNMFRINSGAMWQQKKQTLVLLNGTVDVSPTNASDPLAPDGNTYIIRQESYANTIWPTNTWGTKFYVSTNADNKANMTSTLSQDTLIHNNVQQTNHTFVITELTPPNPAPFR